MSYVGTGLAAAAGSGDFRLDVARAAAQAKLADALGQYRGMANDIRRLVAGVPITATKFKEARSIARSGGPSGLVRMTREQLASLIGGTFAKVEDLLLKSMVLVAVAPNVQVFGAVDQAITAAMGSMATLRRLNQAVSQATSAVSGLGDVGSAGATLAIVVGILTLPAGGIGILLIAGGVGYLLVQNNDQLDRAEQNITEHIARARTYCEGRPDRDACLDEVNRLTRTAAETESALIRARAEADRIIAEGRDPLNLILRPLGQATPYLVAGGAVLVFGTAVYFTWPLLAGFRRGAKAVVGNRRRRRERRRHGRAA